MKKLFILLMGFMGLLIQNPALGSQDEYGDEEARKFFAGQGIHLGENQEMWDPEGTIRYKIKSLSAMPKPNQKPPYALKVTFEDCEGVTYYDYPKKAQDKKPLDCVFDRYEHFPIVKKYLDGEILPMHAAQAMEPYLEIDHGHDKYESRFYKFFMMRYPGYPSRLPQKTYPVFKRK